MSVTTNGKPRRQLADQLDRLDGIIDALSEGLNQAVADAARDGTRAAIADVLMDLLTDPEVMTLVRTAAGAPPETATTDEYRPTLLARVGRAVRSAVSGLVDRARSIARAVAVKTAAVTSRMAATAGYVRTAAAVIPLLLASVPRRYAVAIGLAVGSAAGLVARPEVVLAGLAAATLVLATPAIRRYRQTSARSADGDRSTCYPVT